MMFPVMETGLSVSTERNSGIKLVDHINRIGSYHLAIIMGWPFVPRKELDYIFHACGWIKFIILDGDG
jgi:hypothetical protein